MFIIYLTCSRVSDQEREQRKMSTQSVMESEGWWVGMDRVRWTRMASEAKVEAWKGLPVGSSTKTH